MIDRRVLPLVVSLLWSGVSIAGEAQAPKLEDVLPPTAAAGVEATARPLPRGQVICIDRARRSCWSGDRTADCESAGGQVFATSPLQGGDPGRLLRSCWDELK